MPPSNESALMMQLVLCLVTTTSNERLGGAEESSSCIQRCLEDLEFIRLSCTLYIFGFGVDGNMEASSPYSSPVDVSQHGAQ